MGHHHPAAVSNGGASAALHLRANLSAKRTACQTLFRPQSSPKLKTLLFEAARISRNSAVERARRISDIMDAPRRKQWPAPILILQDRPICEGTPSRPDDACSSAGPADESPIPPRINMLRGEKLWRRLSENEHSATKSLPRIARDHVFRQMYAWQKRV